jgi:hypothetical protein
MFQAYCKNKHGRFKWQGDFNEESDACKIVEAKAKEVSTERLVWINTPRCKDLCFKDSEDVYGFVRDKPTLG